MGQKAQDDDSANFLSGLAKKNIHRHTFPPKDTAQESLTRCDVAAITTMYTKVLGGSFQQPRLCGAISGTLHRKCSQPQLHPPLHLDIEKTVSPMDQSFWGPPADAMRVKT